MLTWQGVLKPGIKASVIELTQSKLAKRRQQQEEEAAAAKKKQQEDDEDEDYISESDVSCRPL